MTQGVPAGPARVFSIPAGGPFLAALAAGIRAELGDDPLVLARATVLLPNRRAVRALGEAFLLAGDGKPTWRYGTLTDVVDAAVTGKFKPSRWN